jgi:hypothetical protein
VSPGVEERPLLSHLTVAVLRSEKLVGETGTVREPRGREGRPSLEAAVKQRIV